MSCDPGTFTNQDFNGISSAMGTHVSFIFRGYNPYIGVQNLHFSWFWGPRDGFIQKLFNWNPLLANLILYQVGTVPTGNLPPLILRQSQHLKRSMNSTFLEKESTLFRLILFDEDLPSGKLT